MTTETRPLPAATLRLGSLKCTIWPNIGGKDRTYYSAHIVRSYRLSADRREQDDDGWRETSSMQEEDLIVMQELSRRAAEWIQQRNAADVELADRTSNKS